MFQELSKAKARELKSLSSKKGREELNLFLVEGEKSVIDTLGHFKLEYLICKKSWLDLYQKIILQYLDKVLIADNRGMEIISTLNSPPDVVAVYKIPDPKNQNITLCKDKLYLLLDEIQDPGNLGTIIRTCDWFGIYDIFASENTVDVYSPKVIKSTMGSLSRVRIHYLNLKKLIEEHTDFPIIGALLDGKSVYESNISPTGFLIMGNEGSGISQELIKLVNKPISIPPKNKLSHPDSLNVAIATGIILSHITGK